MKRVLAMLVLVSMLIGMVPLTSMAATYVLAEQESNMSFKSENVYLSIIPEMITDLGGWRYQDGVEMKSYREKIMFDKGEGADSATFNFKVPANGEYVIFAHTRDWAENQSGARRFDLLIDETTIGTGGDHLLEGWAWEKIGTANLTSGEHKMIFDKLDDDYTNTLGRMARFDMILITDDKDFFPENTFDALTTLEKKYNYYGEETANLELPYPKLSNMTFHDGYEYYSITPELIEEKGDMGGWTHQDNIWKSYRNKYMFDMGDGSGESATLTIKVPKADTYRVYVHARDYAKQSPGSRLFDVKVDGKFVGTGGNHLGQGWAWQPMDSIYLTGGEHTLEFVNRTLMARFDIAMITNDPEFFPGNTVDDLRLLESGYLYDASKVQVEKVDNTVGRPDTEIAVKFNGEWMTFDVDPQLINDRTMVPMRAIFEKLGCSVSWNDNTETATGIRNGKKVSVTIGSDAATVGDGTVKIDQSAVLINDRTLVPLRFVSEAYGANVDWDNDNQIVTINATIPADAYYVTDTSYQSYGTWKPEFSEGSGVGALIGTQPEVDPNDPVVGLEDADTSYQKPAVCRFNVTKGGDYRIWVRGRDFATNQQGARSFNVDVNGKRTERTYGQHGSDGFRWENGGVVHLNKGENVLEIHDTSGYFSRLAGVFFTEDLNMTPPDNHEQLLSIANHVDPLEGLEADPFPLWATQDAPAIETFTVASDKIKVNFYVVNDSARGNFVQNEILINDNGNWVTSKAKTEQFGMLEIRADYAEDAGEAEGMYTLKTKYVKDGVEQDYTTRELYRYGIGDWLIPRSAEQIADNKVKVTYSGNLNGTTVSEIWEFDNIATAPKVTMNATIGNAGYYTFVLSNGSEVFDSDMEAVTLPFRVVEQRAPQDSSMVMGKYMFTPMTTVTIKADKSGFGKSLTKGIVVDGTELPVWTYRADSTYVGGLRGASNGLQGTLATPILGYENSKFNAGDTYSFVYRPVNEIGSWFDAYKSVAENVFNYYDLRTNYYTNLNDAIYNATDYMMDDLHSGWDNNAMAHTNMEGIMMASVANPLEAVQRYLLTENEDIMTRRAIPTLAFMLGRSHWHMRRTAMEYPGAVVFDQPVTAIGGPNVSHNAMTFTSAYDMTKGAIPAMLGISEEQGEIYALGYFKAENSLGLYQTTGDKKYLEEAKEYTDVYLKETLESDAYMTGTPMWMRFVNTDYYPNLDVFLDMYEATGEQKYLDAAKKAGEMMVTVTWVPGYDNGKDKETYTVIDDAVYEKKGTGSTPYYYWYGPVQWRKPGEYGEFWPDGVIKEGLIPEEETVPYWLPSRVGLTIEMAYTFDKVDGGHVTMSHWANSLIRLAEYTGEEYFDTVAKNALVGRFGGYAGYYYDRFTVHDKKAEYQWVGPDTTSFYPHQLAANIAMLEDFLITDVWARSDQAIEFPSVRTHGFAWFSSKHYGFAPGKVYDMNDMWLWLDRGIVELDTVMLNYLPAKKDGLLAISFINTAASDVTSTVSLGDKIEGGSSYSGTATLYDANGNKSTTEVKDGKFQITVPAKGINTIALKIDTIKKPAHASMETYTDGSELGGTVSEHTRGRGYTLQISPDKYYAYIYATDADEREPVTKDRPARAAGATLTYTVNGKTETVTNDIYPYEFVIPVDDVNAELTYKISVHKLDGSAEELGGGTLMTAKRSKEQGIKSNLAATYGTVKKVDLNVRPAISKDLKKFEPFKIVYNTQGTGDGVLRYVVEKNQVPFEVTENLLAGADATVVLTDVKTNESFTVETFVTALEIRADGKLTLCVKATDKMPVRTYDDNWQNVTHEMDVTISYPLK